MHIIEEHNLNVDNYMIHVVDKQTCFQATFTITMYCAFETIYNPLNCNEQAYLHDAGNTFLTTVIQLCKRS